MRIPFKEQWGKLLNFIYPEHTPKPNKVIQRLARMILQGISSLLITGLSIWLAYRELGSDMFSDNIFWLLALMWVYVNIALFLPRLDDLTKKDTNEKIDDLSKDIRKLIREIRQDRKYREKVGKNGV